MPNKINISVIILTYNEEISVKDTLDSIINNFSEIIILDSHSTDQTINICKKYTSKIFFRKFDKIMFINHITATFKGHFPEDIWIKQRGSRLTFRPINSPSTAITLPNCKSSGKSFL